MDAVAKIVFLALVFGAIYYVGGYIVAQSADTLWTAAALSAVLIVLAVAGAGLTAIGGFLREKKQS